MTEFERSLEPILTQDPRYGRGAYLFLREAIDETKSDLMIREGKDRHINGAELLDGLKHLALIQFGPMAWTVLDDWGIHCCADWGEVVFNLIEHKVLTKTDQDSKADFQGGYDFHETFRRPFQRTT